MADVVPLRAGDPERVGPYEIVGRLGRGGQGTVYLGHRVDDPQRTQVAVKLLHPHFTDDPKARQRLLREASFASKVARFCTAQVLDYGEDDERVYLVSEYVAGSSLTELLERDGPRTGVALERLAISTVTALAAIHEAGVVHLDLKPANVLMGSDGPIVIDFGIAKALDGAATASTAQVVGSPAYMAPEQYSGTDVGPATDMFAWGVTMVHAATGTPAFGLASGPAMMQRILLGEPDLSGLEPPLREIVGACVAKDPTVRPSAQEVLLSLIGKSQTTTPDLGPRPGPLTTPDPAPPLFYAAAGPERHAAAENLAPPAAEVFVPPMPPPYSAPMAQPGAMPAPYPAAKPGNGRTKVLAIVGAAAAVVAIAVAAIAIPMLGKSDQNAAVGETTGATPTGGSPTPGTSAGPGSLPGGSSTRAASGSASAKSGPTSPQQTSAKAAPPPPQPSKGYVPPPPQSGSGSGSTARAMPWTLQQICGSGMSVVDSHSLGRATVYLMYDNSSGMNCVTTTVQTSTGTNTMGAYVARQGGPSGTDTGSYAFYAGPVKVSARATCVKWGGTYGSASWTSSWSHCG